MTHLVDQRYLLTMISGIEPEHNNNKQSSNDIWKLCYNIVLFAPFKRDGDFMSDQINTINKDEILEMFEDVRPLTYGDDHSAYEMWQICYKIVKHAHVINKRKDDGDDID